MPPIGFNSVKPKDAKGSLLRMLRYLSDHRLLLAAILVMTFVSNMLSLQGPRLAGQAIREAAAGKGMVNMERVWHAVWLMLAFYLISSALTIVINIAMLYISKWVGQKMRRDIFDKLMKLPVGFFDRNQAGDIISRVSYDVDVVSTCLASDVVQILTCSVTVVGSLFMMLTISLPLSAIVLITIPIAIRTTVRMRRRTRPLFRHRSAKYGEMNGYVEEMFTGQKTIQAYAYENRISERFETVNREAARAYYEADRTASTMGPRLGFVNNLSLALVSMLGSVLIMYGKADLGQISSFVLYSRKFAGPINEVAGITNEIFSALSAAERVFTLLDSEEEITDRENAADYSEVQGHVEADHVSFGYEPGKTILHDLSMDALSGKTIAIVGPTGAGKTTIINLLMRFYDVNSGAILADGKDIRDYTRAGLRGAYAMVLQETWLFRGTIYDNIAYGKEGATMDEVVAAAKAANIHSFIMQLPDGYRTVISDDGSNISKGQKQLLTIARAMLYDAKMLILDEATSNVDTGTERKVQKAMRDLMRGKTCFVIAHRLSTIRNADLILVVNHGDVVEQGTHEELMAQKGFYRSLYAAQFE